MAPEDVNPRLTAILESDILAGQFSVEAGLMLGSLLVKDRKLSAAMGWSSLGWSAGSRIWETYKKHRKASEKTYSVKIDVNDPIFDVLSQWILQDTPEHEQFVVEVHRAYRSRSKNSDPGSIDALLDDLMDAGLEVGSVGPGAKPSGNYQNLAIEVDDNRALPLVVGEHTLSVAFVLPGQASQAKTDPDYGGNQQKQQDRYLGEPHYLVTCQSLAARNALLAKIDAEFKADEKRLPGVYRANAWGEMEKTGDVPPRKLDTVILKPGQIEALVDDITQFLHSEEKYVNLGIPYHHGVLLYGPPGTGKTSIVAAVATALNLDVYAIPLSTIRDDAALANTFRAVKPRSVLLIEDIDTCRASRKDGESEKSTDGPTINGLLQSLDGFASPHGLVTVMTTNHPGVLDERLTREGRVDARIEVDCVDTDQVARLCKQFIGYIPEDLPVLQPADSISPAKIVDVFKDHLFDTENAGAALVKRLNELLTSQQDQFDAQQYSADMLMRLNKPDLQKMADDAGIKFTSKTTKPVLVAGLLGK